MKANHMMLIVMSVLRNIENDNNIDYSVSIEDNSPYQTAIKIAEKEGWLTIISEERIKDSDYLKNAEPIKRFKYYMSLTEVGSVMLRYHEL